MKEPLLRFFLPEFDLPVAHLFLLGVCQRGVLLVGCLLRHIAVQLFNQSVIIFYKTL